MTHVVRGEGLDLREVRIKVQLTKVILQEVTHGQREIVVPEIRTCHRFLFSENDLFLPVDNWVLVENVEGEFKVGFGRRFFADAGGDDVDGLCRRHAEADAHEHDDEGGGHAHDYGVPLGVDKIRVDHVCAPIY